MWGFHGDTLEVLLSQNTLVHTPMPAALSNWGLFALQRRPQLVYVRFLPRLEPEPSAAVTSARGRDGDVRCGKQTVALERREPAERPIKVSHSSLALPLGSTTPLHNSVPLPCLARIQCLCSWPIHINRVPFFALISGCEARIEPMSHPV